MATTLSPAVHAERDPARDPRAGKYLVFRLAPEDFAIQVEKIREILGIQEVTRVPQTPAYVRGVINLRGKVIPVVDLRLKFGMPPADYTHHTCIVVVQLAGTQGPIPMGLIVDSVAEVAQVSAEEIENTPVFGADLPVPYVLGLAKRKGRVKILLDIDRAIGDRAIGDRAIGAPGTGASGQAPPRPAGE